MLREDLLGYMFRDGISKINEKINEELMSENVNKHRIAKLREQKIIQGLFSQEYGVSNAKYRLPW